MQNSKPIGKILQPTNSHIVTVKSTTLNSKTAEAEKMGAHKRNTIITHDKKTAKVLES